jgi:hypothetical protein
MEAHTKEAQEQAQAQEQGTGTPFPAPIVPIPNCAAQAAEAEAAAALAPLRVFDGQEEWLVPRSACEASVLPGVGVWVGMMCC